MCLGTMIMPGCVVVSAVSLHTEQEFPRDSPQNSQTSKHSTEMWGSLGQVTRDKITGML